MNLAALPGARRAAHVDPMDVPLPIGRGEHPQISPSGRRRTARMAVPRWSEQQTLRDGMEASWGKFFAFLEFFVVYPLNFRMPNKHALFCQRSATISPESSFKVVPRSVGDEFIRKWVPRPHRDAWRQTVNRRGSWLIAVLALCASPSAVRRTPHGCPSSQSSALCAAHSWRVACRVVMTWLVSSSPPPSVRPKNVRHSSPAETAGAQAYPLLSPV